jgi:hypothetical protein
VAVAIITICIQAVMMMRKYFLIPLPTTILYFLIEHDRKSLGCLSYNVYVPIKNVRCCYIPVSQCVRLAKLVETIERVGWISGIIVALFTLAPFSIKDLPSGLQFIPISVAELS